MNTSCFRVLACMIGAILLVGCGSKASMVGVATVVPHGNSNDVQTVQSDVTHLLNAIYHNEVDIVLGYTHPEIIKLLGGSVQAANVLKNTLHQIQTAGLELESSTFPKEPSFLKSALHEFAIVPTKSVMVARGQRVESLNYQFGIKEAGATNWTYIEGSRINSTNVNKFFSDFPSNFQFPDYYRKKL